MKDGKVIQTSDVLSIELADERERSIDNVKTNGNKSGYSALSAKI